MIMYLSLLCWREYNFKAVSLSGYSMAEPITSINSPKQTYAEVINGGSSFLEQD